MNFYLQLAIFLFAYMNFWFILSIKFKRNDIADVAWGLGFVLLNWLALIVSRSFELQNILAATLISIWGLRLSVHIHLRNHNKAEDFRYKQWRIDWGKWFYLRSWLQVYMLQGLFLFLIMLPVMMFHYYPLKPFSWYAGLGVIIWIIGFYFEAKSDFQLTKFKKQPGNKGKIMRSGLWRHSRHPNYFGEVVLWWGIYLVCINSIPAWPSILGPLIISWLIIFVSGIPMLEKKYADREDYAKYKAETSVFFPLPNKLI